jgi:hypothetical protein
MHRPHRHGRHWAGPPLRQAGPSRRGLTVKGFALSFRPTWMGFPPRGLLSSSLHGAAGHESCHVQRRRAGNCTTKLIDPGQGSTRETSVSNQPAVARLQRIRSTHAAEGEIVPTAAGFSGLELCSCLHRRIAYNRVKAMFRSFYSLKAVGAAGLSTATASTT